MSRCSCRSAWLLLGRGESGKCPAVAVQVPGYCCKEGESGECSAVAVEVLGYCWEEGESGGCSAVAVQVPVITVKRGNQEDVPL